MLPVMDAPPLSPPSPPRVLRATELRYVLTRILQLNGPSSVADVVAELHRWGFIVAGRPSKTVSDALRWEIGRGRVFRTGRGRYRAGWAPRSTEHRIIQRVDAMRQDVLSREGGQHRPLFPD